ncbi:hypothetical protein [Aquella oligotrophica]|uniref:Uncharacterized protein n=1 Tax=Aquella oligotrophica TaxID=2067065 RepID=A0A2I7N810_9NEIS|nr:hypothetical protein [Aquella oligotrophica]AUR52596.1 hypothetical protein CUN60_09905 [Aquella oligotrophica]
MKTKLISLLTCLAVNSYAVNTIISLPSSELSGFTVIRAEIATTAGIKSAEQNCNNVSYCNLTLPGLSLTPGMHEVSIYATNNGKKIGSASIEKFANTPGDEIYNISLNAASINFANAPLLQTSRNNMDGNSIDDYRLVSQRVSASFKIIAAVFPGFKQVSDLGGGIVELMFPRGGGGGDTTTSKQLTIAIELITQVGAQVQRVENQLINFYTKYNKDRFQDKLANLNTNLAIINQLSQQISNTLNQSNKSLLEYIKALQKAEPLPIVIKFFQTQRDPAELALNNIMGNNGDNLTNLKSSLDALIHETSRDGAKINYIALNSFYNAQYVKMYVDILTTIASMQQIDTLGATLISKDFPYANIYNTHIAIKINGVSSTNTIAQNAEVVRKFYAEKIKLLMDKLPVDKNSLKDIYGSIRLKFDDPSQFTTEGILDPTKLSSLAGLNLKSYDGTTLVGTYGGNAKSNWPTAADFSVPFKSIQNSTLRVVNGQTIFIPAEAREHGYNGITRLVYVDHRESRRERKESKAEQGSAEGHAMFWRKDRFYHKNGSKAFYDIPVISELNYRNLTRLYVEGDAHKYEWNHPLEVINGNHIRMNRPNYETKVSGQGDVEPRYAIYSVSGGGVPNNTQYVFGIKYGAWGWNEGNYYSVSLHYREYRWRDLWSWGFRLFCPTLNCKQLDYQTLAYPDGTFVKITGEWSDAKILVTRDSQYAWNKYQITTKFPEKGYNYMYYAPKLGPIKSGSHDLAPNATDVFYNPEKVVRFRYSFGMQDINRIGQDDTPQFDLNMENNYCHSYGTKFGKNLRTCVYDKGNNHFEIVTTD